MRKVSFQSEYVDVVKVLRQDDSADHDIKWANEYKAFALSPFTHTIKLEADMLWTTTQTGGGTTYGNKILCSVLIVEITGTTL